MISTICWSELACAAGAQCSTTVGANMVRALDIDSRKVEPGSVFFALPGEHTDGHQFIGRARKKGAIAAVVTHQQDDMIEQLIVADPKYALAKMAQLNRDKFSGVVIAITGSVGKTTCKNIISSILLQVGSVCSTQGNKNNELGVPLTLQRITEKDRYAVLELGAAKPGDIIYLTNMVQPDVALVTKVAASHIEGFGSIEKIAKEKGEIYLSLRDGGTAVVNVDEPFTKNWLTAIRKTNENINVLTFSQTGAPADVRLVDTSPTQTGVAMIVDVVARGSLMRCSTAAKPADGNTVERWELNVPLLGEHNVENALAAIAACLAISIDQSSITRGLSMVDAEQGRLNVVDLGGDKIVIDDTYNASPASAKAAIDVLTTRYQNRQKIIVLGEMAELGRQTSEYHQQVGAYAAYSGVDILVAVGEYRHDYAIGFEKNSRSGSAMKFLKKSQAINWLVKKNGPVAILVKGSRCARMDDLVQGLKEAFWREGAV